jgi:PAS domain S-box-containing protein
MMRLQSSLIVKIALLVIGVEMIAFGVLGSFYIERFSTAADEQVRSRLQLVRQLIAQNELQINAISRTPLMSNLLGVNYLKGMVIGGNQRVIVSTDAAMLGHSIREVSGFDPRWFADAAPDLQYIPGLGDLTSVMCIRDPQGNPLYYGVLTIDTTGINTQKRAIAIWGWSASLLFILLSSIGIILIVHRFFSRRVESTLQVLKQVEGGAMEMRIPVSSRDEMGELQFGINSMIGNIGTLLTRHRRNEEELSAILDSISEGLIAIDRDARIVRINTNAKQLLGEEHALGKGRKLSDYLPAVSTAEKALCAAALTDGQRLSGIQFELADLDGNLRSIEGWR